MSGGFLTNDQIHNYDCYSADPNEVQLAKYFHLDECDLDFIIFVGTGTTGLALLFNSPQPVFWVRYHSCCD